MEDSTTESPTTESPIAEVPATQIPEEIIEIGDISIDGIEVISFIGNGGMGQVFKGREISLNRTVAIKFARGGPKWKTFKESFKKEPQFLAKFNSPNINEIIKIGQTTINNRLWDYAVLKFIDNALDLLQYTKKKQLSTLNILDTFLIVCKAVRHIHSKSVIHCDIKPANVLVDSEGNPWITDFGIAQALSEGEVIGTGLGTKAFMSPEALRSGALDERTDIYSLGVMLYLLIEGNLPYPATQKRDPSVSIKPHKKLIDPLFQVIKKCLSRRKDDRYRRVEGLIAAIEQVRKKPQDLEHFIRKFVIYQPSSSIEREAAKNDFNNKSDFRRRLLAESIRYAEDAIIKEVGQIAEKHGASSAWLFLNEEVSGTPLMCLDRKLSHNTPVGGEEKKFRYCDHTTPRSERSVVGYVAQTLDPYFLTDATNDPFYLSCDNNTKSELAIPLIMSFGPEKRRLIGVLNLESRTQNTFLATQIGGLVSMSLVLIRHLDILISCRNAETNGDYAWHPEYYKWDLKNVMQEFTSCASLWLAQLAKIDGSELSAPPSCSVWHCDPNDDELFILSTSRFDYEYVDKLTLPKESFTGSIQSLDKGSVVYIDTLTDAPQFIRTGKAQLMGVESIFAAKISVPETKWFPGFSGSISIYFFEGENVFGTSKQKKKQIAIAASTLVEILEKIITDCVTIQKNAVQCITLESLNTASLPGVNDQNKLVSLVAELTNSSGCTIFARRNYSTKSATTESHVLQGLASLTELIDAEGNCVLPRNAIYSLREEGDKGLTIALLDQENARIVRLNSTEPTWRTRLSNLTNYLVRNKYREKFSLTESEHRPFIGGAVVDQGSRVGVIRAVRNSEAAPFSVFDEFTLDLIRKVAARRFNWWASRGTPSDLKLFFILGAQFPFVAKMVKDDKSQGLLRSLRRIATPLPDDSIWTYRQVEATLDDLLALIHGATLVMFRISDSDFENQEMDHHFHLLAARSPLLKNPIGPHEFGADKRLNDALERKACSLRHIICGERQSSIKTQHLHSVNLSSKVVCVPFSLMPSGRNSKKTLTCVITLECPQDIDINYEILNVLHLARVKLSFISMTNQTFPNLPSPLVDWKVGLIQFLREVKSFVHGIVACELWDIERKIQMAKCGKREIDDADWRNLKTTRFGPEKIESKFPKRDNGKICFGLKYGDLQTSYYFRAVVTFEESEMCSKIAMILAFWNRFTLFKSGQDDSPFLYPYFTSTTDYDVTIWNAQVKARVLL